MEGLELSTSCSQSRRSTIDLHPEYLGSGGWIRTNDLQVMSLTSYRAALPRINYFIILLLFHEFVNKIFQQTIMCALMPMF